MNILENQHPISYTNNKCKKSFLTNQIKQMKHIKNNYYHIFNDFKYIVKDVHNLIYLKQNHLINNELYNHKSQQKLKLYSRQVQINQNIRNLINSIKQKKNQFSSIAATKNILQYLEIQQQSSSSYNQIIKKYKQFIKNQQKSINHRQNQLQSFEQLKNPSNLKQQSKINTQQFIKILPKQKWKQLTQKNLQAFDFNHKILQLIRNQIVMLKLQKKKLQAQLMQKKIKQQNNIKELVSDSLQTTKIDNCLQQKENLIKNTKKQAPKSRFHPDQNIIKNKDSKSINTPNIINFAYILPNKISLKTPNIIKKNQVSGFQKIVLIYQKQKYLNDQLEDKINKLKIKTKNKKALNILFKQKTIDLDKQIQKIQWNSVCDQSLFMSLDKKGQIQNIQSVEQQLSLLDRTNLLLSDQISQQYSQFSINQSIIN